MALDDGKLYSAITRTLKKWENDRSPEDGEPDEVDTKTYFVDSDGNEVVDSDKIAELTERFNNKLVQMKG